MAATAIRSPAEDAPPVARPLLPDPLLVLAALGLGVCSLLALDHSAPELVSRQVAFYVFGLAGALVLWRIDYSRLRELKYGLYALLMASIVAVLAFGSVTRGSRRAIETPFFEIQTSELGKVLLVLALAAFVVDGARHLSDRRHTARLVLLALVPAAFVIGTDLGSGLVYLAILLAVLFTAGVPMRHVGGLLALGAAALTLVIVAAPAVGVDVLKPYQEERLTSFLHPSDDPADAGYQQNQSRIAIGSGEKLGRGEEATQTTLSFLPEAHTDFIFAVVGETYGFVGAALVLSLYALLIWRGLRILTMAKNLFGALVAGGIVAMLLFQVFVNVGMNVGIMPITGIPLPLVSYGGSSVVSTLLAVGLLLSIHAQARASAAGKSRAITY